MNLNIKKHTIRRALTKIKSKTQVSNIVSSIAILFFASISLYVVVYQIKNISSVDTDKNILSVSKVQLSPEELKLIADILRRDSMGNPPPTARELNTMVTALNKDAKNQKKLTAEELQNISKKLNEN